MASWGKVEFGQLKQFQKELEQIQQKELDVFLTSCTKELAARLLAFLFVPLLHTLDVPA